MIDLQRKYQTDSKMLVYGYDFFIRREYYSDIPEENNKNIHVKIHPMFCELRFKLNFALSAV